MSEVARSPISGSVENAGGGTAATRGVATAPAPVPELVLFAPGHPSTHLHSPLQLGGRLLGVPGGTLSEISLVLREIDARGERGNTRVLSSSVSLSRAFIRELRGEKHPDNTFEFQASVDITAYLRRSVQERRSFELELQCRWDRSGAELESNRIKIAVLAPELFNSPIGGFDFPTGREFVGEVLSVAGWALSPMGSLQRVKIRLGGADVGYVGAPLSSPQVKMAFPDAPGAACAGFVATIRHQEVRSFFARQLSQRVELVADCLFSDGATLSIRSPAFVWKARTAAKPSLQLINASQTAHGTLRLEGVLEGCGSSAQLVVTGRKRAFGFSSDQKSTAGNIQWFRVPTVENARCAEVEVERCGFTLECDPALFGRLPGWVNLYALVGPDAERIDVSGRAQLAQFNRLLRASISSNLPLVDRLRTIHAVISELVSRLRNLYRGPSLNHSPMVESVRRHRRATPPRTMPRCYALGFHNLSLCEGAPRVMLQVVQALREESAENEIIVFSALGGQGEGLLKQLEVPVHFFPELSTERLNWETFHRKRRELAALLKIYEVDRVFANTLDSFWLLDAARALSLPKAWLIHESVNPAAWSPLMEPRLRARFFHNLSHCDQLIFVSEATRILFTDFLGQSRSCVVPNGIDVAEWQRRKALYPRDITRERLGVKQGEFVVSIIGTTTERKGQDVLVNAIAKLQASNPEVPLRAFIVGARPGYFLDQLRQLVSSQALEDKVEFVAELGDVMPYLVASDAIVIASRNESSPLVALEAFALERPLISTTVFGLAELVSEGRALTFPNEQSDALAERILELRNEPAIAGKLTERALEFVKQERDIEGTMARYVKILKRPSRGAQHI